MKDCNCKVLGEGNSKGDHAHVSTSSPISLKRKELAMIPKEDGVIKSSVAMRKDKAGVRPL